MTVTNVSSLPFSWSVMSCRQRYVLSITICPCQLEISMSSFYNVTPHTIIHYFIAFYITLIFQTKNENTTGATKTTMIACRSGFLSWSLLSLLEISWHFSHHCQPFATICNTCRVDIVYFAPGNRHISPCSILMLNGTRLGGDTYGCVRPAIVYRLCLCQKAQI